MYANKESAMCGYTTDRTFGLKRVKDVCKNFWKDKAARYYFVGMFFLIIGGGMLLMTKYDDQRQIQGLLGAKRKKYKSRLTVVLDVDETICSYGDKAYRLKASLVPRPYLAEFLDYLNSIDAEVILWSACSERYMKSVVHAIDPNGVRISSFLTRDNTWYTDDHYYEKNLRWLGRDLDTTVFFENRPLSIRACNHNSVLVDDFIRGEYMDNGEDYPRHDTALKEAMQIVKELHEKTELTVPEYLDNPEVRYKGIKTIPCHLAMRQMPDELAVGNFHFIGDKYKPGGQTPDDTDRKLHAGRAAQ
jgi:hypothetical protein